MPARTLPLRSPLALGPTFGRLRRGAGDPAVRLAADELWRATRTPEGPATTQVLVRRGLAEVRAWGPGADWALEAAPALLGQHDDGTGFAPRHPVLAALARRLPGLRIPRTGAVLEALVPAVLEQKVLGVEARRAYRSLLWCLGEPAPGPGAALGLRVPPPAARLASTPSYAFHRWGVERKRADAVRLAAGCARRLEEVVTLDRRAAYGRLTALPGLGPWTAAEVALVALGDCDAVSVGDFHLKHLVCFALAGEARGTDERMLELLEPYRGQRARVVRLLEVGGPRPPRRGPRLPLQSIARL